MKKFLLILLGLFALVSCGQDNTTTSVLEESALQESGQNGTETPSSASSTSSTTTTAEVLGQKGTLENPYSIAEALEIIGTSTNFSTEKIYITGIVSSEPYYNKKYNSYSVYLKDPDGSKTVEVYSATLDSSVSGVPNVGDTVVSGGYYTYYEKNKQPELAGSKTVEYPIIYKIIPASE